MLKKFSLALLVVIIIVLAAIPLLLDVERYREEIESQLSEASGTQINLGRLQLAFFPVPSITARDATIKDGKDRLLATIGSARIAPDIRQLADGQIDITSLDLVDVYAGQEILSLLAPHLELKPAAGRGMQLSLEKFSIENLHISMPGRETLGPLRVKGVLDQDLTLHTLDASLSGNTARGRLKAIEDGFIFTIDAVGWRLPVEYDVFLDALHARGKLHEGGIIAEELVIEAWSGTASGHAELQWGLELKLTGDTTIDDMELDPIAGSPVTGRLDGDFSFRAQAPLGKPC